MPSFNQVTLLGNITRAVELRYTPAGKAVCDLSIAVNRKWTDDSGQKHEDATFVECSLFGRTAEVAAEYCKKGDPLFIQGRLSLDAWKDRETGKDRSKLKVIGEQIQLLGARPSANAASPTGNQPPQRQAAPPQAKSAAPAPQRREPALDDPALAAEPDDCPF
jgi:single-strand DNA-binding protein